MEILPVRVGTEILPGPLTEQVCVPDLQQGDILVIAQKAVSKAEGMLVDLSTVAPSLRARMLAEELHETPEFIEVVLTDTEKIISKGESALLVRTVHGMICINAGVDRSNVGVGKACRLPTDSDASAKALAEHWQVPVIISDTHSRYHRAGIINIAIGCYGVEPFEQYAGRRDPYGYELQSSTVCVADELASAAELMMGKLERTPVVIIRDYPYTPGITSAKTVYDTRIGRIMREAEKLGMGVTWQH